MLSQKWIRIINARIVNEGQIIESDLIIKGERIEYLGSKTPENNLIEIDAKGKLLLPGIIDDQVHFREPGLTHKANIYSESRAAVAGGVTSFMEMPNTRPAATSLTLLQEKYDIAAQDSAANYSFYLGASENNIEEIKNASPQEICGIKIFMGSSTGDLLVEKEDALNQIFKHAPMLIATHCEDEKLFQSKLEEFKTNFCDHISPESHEFIRSREGCVLSSTKAIRLAKANDSRLHILHISTAEEANLFDHFTPLARKKITAEVCVHHLFFDHTYYSILKNKIKCNPSIKSPSDRLALINALNEDFLDIIATDHAPHLLNEKGDHYVSAAAGLPLVQHGLNVMLSLYHDGQISLQKIVEKMCHAPSICFQIKDRGFIREGYYADLILVDENEIQKIDQSTILYKCGWSPFESIPLRGKIISTWVNGNLVYENGLLAQGNFGQRLYFDR